MTRGVVSGHMPYLDAASGSHHPRHHRDRGEQHRKSYGASG
ncbi:hypothetical protein [Mycobacterium noviomagense]|nr:hypothetical protein [Mycobacterium noviomagense]